jgi:hypothetical protein
LLLRSFGKITVNQAFTVIFLFGGYAKNSVLEHPARTKSVTLSPTRKMSPN